MPTSAYVAWMHCRPITRTALLHQAVPFDPGQKRSLTQYVYTGTLTPTLDHLFCMISVNRCLLLFLTWSNNAFFQPMYFNVFPLYMRHLPCFMISSQNLRRGRIILTTVKFFVSSVGQAVPDMQVFLIVRHSLTYQIAYSQP
jgi:hypothetical protein